MTSGEWDLNALELLDREAREQFGLQEFPAAALSPPSSLSSSQHQHHPHRAPSLVLLTHSAAAAAAAGLSVGGGSVSGGGCGSSIAGSSSSRACSDATDIVCDAPALQYVAYLKQELPPPPPMPASLLQRNLLQRLHQQQHQQQSQQQRQQQWQLHPSHNCPLNPHHQELLQQQHHQQHPKQQQQHEHHCHQRMRDIAARRNAAATSGGTDTPAAAAAFIGAPTVITDTAAAATADVLDEELEDHIKHCTCSCNHMGYGNFMDYQQTTNISGLPDVTEPSNHLQQKHTKFDIAAPMSPATASPIDHQHQQHYNHHNNHQHHHQHQHHRQQHHHHHHAKHKAATVCYRDSSDGSSSIGGSGAYIADLIHSFKAPPSPLRLSPSRTTTLDDMLSAKSDTDLSSSGAGSKKDFPHHQNHHHHHFHSQRQLSQRQHPHQHQAERRRSLRDGCRRARGAASDCCAGLQCVSCSVLVAIAAVAVLLGLAIALSVADVDVVAGWFGGGRRPGKSNENRMRVVRRVLQQTPLIDGHNDLPWNIRRYAYNRLENVSSFGIGLNNVEPWSRSAWSQTDWPRLRAGQVGAQFWSAQVPCPSAADDLDAVQIALEQIDLIHRFTDWHSSRLRLVQSAGEIIETHRDGGNNGKIASLIGVEGGHALGNSLAVLRAMYALGVRYMTLTYTCDTPWAGSAGPDDDDDERNRHQPEITSEAQSSHQQLQIADTEEQSSPALFASSSTTNAPPPRAAHPPKGLSYFGRSVVREMNRLGMMIDLAHASDATVRDVLRESRAPVIYSHAASRSLCNRTRNVPDDALRGIAENGGLIMISFDAARIACSRSANNGGDDARSSSPSVARIADVVAHINYVRAIAGVRHVGIGAGYDGIRNVPLGLEDVSTYPRLFAELLRDPLWTESDLRLLAGENVLRVLQTVETVRDHQANAAAAPIETLAPPRQQQQQQQQHQHNNPSKTTCTNRS